MKIILFLIFTFSIYPLKAQEITFLDWFFEDAEYQSWEEILTPVYERPFEVAVQYEDVGREIITKAVVYSFENGNHKIHLMILGPVIFNGNGDELTDVTGAPGQYWGWGFTESMHLHSGAFLGFNLTSYADEGRSVTDHPGIRWNSETRVFELQQIDRSML